MNHVELNRRSGGGVWVLLWGIDAFNPWMGFHYAHEPSLRWVDLHPLARICGGNCGELDQWLGRWSCGAVLACHLWPIRAALSHGRS
jgi:hypothetical protein